MATPPDFVNATPLDASSLNALGLWLVKTQTITGTPTSVNVTSCFNADFQNYVVTFSSIAITGGNGGTINYKLLIGTTPTTNSFFGNTFYIVPGASGGLTNAPFGNTSFGEAISISTNSLNNGIMEIQAPFLTQHTRSQSFGADDNFVRWHSITHRANTSYDGIQFLTSAGNFNAGGTFRVYGYRN
jgi:hypothetical protein